ncbi:MAG: FixH family protein [Bacteroidetes bacterium]|nr:FixH family protein [Bacteroidota bacterium]
MSKNGINWWPATIVFFFILLIGGLVHIVWVGKELFIPPVKDDYKTQQDFFQPESDRRQIQEKSGLDLKMAVSSLTTGPQTLSLSFYPSKMLNLETDTARIILYRATGTTPDQKILQLPSTDSTWVIPVQFTEKGEWFIRTTVPAGSFDFRKEFRMIIR